jgi:hypothetical protein
MSEQAIVGYENGQPVFGELLTQEEKLNRLAKTAEWQEFTALFDMSDTGNQTLLGWLYEEKLGSEPELADYQRLLKIVVAAGGIVKVRGQQYEFETVPVIEEVVEAEVPRDRNGNPLSASQLAWKEFREFSETHSMQECRARARTDAAFGSFLRTNLEREAQGTESTQFRIAGQHPGSPDISGSTSELIAFANEFRRTSMDQVRRLKSPTLNPLGWEKYQKDLDAALAAGLIGR